MARRRWLSFSLRTLLVSVALVSLWLGWLCRVREVREPLRFAPRYMGSNFLALAKEESTGLAVVHCYRRGLLGGVVYYPPLRVVYDSGQPAVLFHLEDFCPPHPPLDQLSVLKLKRFADDMGCDAEYYFADGTQAASYGEFLLGKDDERHALLHKNYLESWRDPRVVEAFLESDAFD